MTDNNQGVQPKAASVDRARMFIHDDFCQSARFWGAGCTCGASKAEARQIVEEVTADFAKALADIQKLDRLFGGHFVKG